MEVENVIISYQKEEAENIKRLLKIISKKNIHLIIVDDGSREELKYIFKEIGKLKNTTILTHAVNLGKGRALKNGFNYC